MSINSFFVKVACVFTCLFTFTFPLICFGQEPYEAKSVILVEPRSGQILAEQNAHEELPPASVTKVMTMLLIYEAVANGKIGWEDKVNISEYAAGMGGSQIFLEPGQTPTVHDLTRSIIIASANDASVAMAEHIAGSEEGFVAMMNERAKALGMNNTNFVNACGLDADGHLTTAHDIALMSSELITKYPEISETALIWMDTITHETRKGAKEFGLTNTNKMVRSYDGITGLKTGSTSKAMFCVSASAKRDDLELVAVVLGSPDSKTRFAQARKLLDYGYTNYASVSGEEAGTQKGTVDVHKGEIDEATLVVKDTIRVVIEKGNDVTLDTTVDTLDFIKAPLPAGTKAGELIYTTNGKEVGRTDLVLAEPIEKANMVHMYRKLIEEFVVG